MDGHFGSIVSQITERSYAVTENFLPDDTLHRLLEEQLRLYREGEFRKARVGKGAEEKLITEIRNDYILWLYKDQLSSAGSAYWKKIDALREFLGQAFLLSLRDFEAHFAVYPSGSFYKKHLDQFRDTSNRILSCILYLNPVWQPEDGGALRIYEPSGKVTDILPEFGRFVCFRSDNIPHEVLATQRERYSITGWMRRGTVL